MRNNMVFVCLASKCFTLDVFFRVLQHGSLDSVCFGRNSIAWRHAQVKQNPILVLDGCHSSSCIFIRSFTLLLSCRNICQWSPGSIRASWTVLYVSFPCIKLTFVGFWFVLWFLNLSYQKVDHMRSSKYQDSESACGIIRHLHIEWHCFCYCIGIRCLVWYSKRIFLSNWHLYCCLLLLDASNDLLYILEYG